MTTKIPKNKSAAPQPPKKDIVDQVTGQFKGLNIDEKIKAYTTMKVAMVEAIEIEAKIADERMSFIKNAWGNLLNK